MSEKQAELEAIRAAVQRELNQFHASVEANLRALLVAESLATDEKKQAELEAHARIIEGEIPLQRDMPQPEDEMSRITNQLDNLDAEGPVYIENVPLAQLDPCRRGTYEARLRYGFMLLGQDEE